MSSGKAIYPLINDAYNKTVYSSQPHGQAVTGRGVFTLPFSHELSSKMYCQACVFAVGLHLKWSLRSIVRTRTPGLLSKVAFPMAHRLNTGPVSENLFCGG